MAAEIVVLINQLWNVSWHLKGQINRKTLLISSEAEITGNMAHKIPRCAAKLSLKPKKSKVGDLALRV